MTIYTIFVAIVAVAAGIVIAVRTKKADHVTYTDLDKAGRIINILMLFVYLRLAPAYLFLGMASEPAHDGILGILGWIVGIIIASASLPCGLGLGFSVALRKKGRSKLSFTVQFAGLAGIGLALALYAIFSGNLLISIN